MAGAGEGKLAQRHIVGGGRGGDADAGAALARQALQVIAAEVCEEGARRGCGAGALRRGGSGPPAVGVVLRDFAALQAVERGDYLRAFEPQLVGNLLRLQSGLPGEKLLDWVDGAHRIPTVAQAGGRWGGGAFNFGPGGDC